MGRATKDDLLFARRDGSTRSPHWLTQKVALTMASLKIDSTLHGLRHTHALQLIAAGMDVLTISRRLGHTTPAIIVGIVFYLAMHSK
jgi:integrase